MSTTDSASSMSTGTQSTKWATISTICFAYFVVAVVLSHLIRIDRNLTTHFLSEYVVRPNGFVMASAFLAFGLGLLTLTSGLWQNVSATSGTKIGLVLLGIAGIAMFVVVIFPTDIQYTPVTQSGFIHDL